MIRYRFYRIISWTNLLQCSLMQINGFEGHADEKEDCITTRNVSSK
jgi:hypothetical protein